MTISVKILPMPRIDFRHVAVLVYSGLGTFELGIVSEIFGLPRPELQPNWYRFDMCALEPGPLRATGGLLVEAKGSLAQMRRAGTIVIPGWKGSHASPPKA